MAETATNAEVMTDPPIPVNVGGSPSATPSTTPSATPPPIPDPTKPYEAPPSSSLPPITPPVQHDPATLQQPSGPRLIPGMKGTGPATIAFGLDSILKGYMRGRDYGEQRKYAQTSRLLGGLQFNYQTSASNYINMLKNGADPNSSEVQQAKAARDAAWTAMMKMYGNYINPQTGKKEGKKSKSGGGGGDQSNPLEQIGSQNPQDKIRGVYAVGVKLGPPDEYIARQYSSPEYRKQLEMQRRQQGLASQEQDVQGDILQKRIDLHKLQNMDQASLKPEERARLERLQNDPELFPQLSHRTPKYAPTDTPGSSLANAKDATGAPIKDVLGNPIDPKMNYRQVTIGNEEQWVPSVAKSPTKGHQAFGKDEHGKFYSFLVDPFTNQKIPGSENYEVQPNAAVREGFPPPDTVRTGEFSWKDDQGVLHRSQTTTTVQHVPHAGGAGGAGSGAGSTSAPPSGHKPSTSTPAPSGDRVIGSTGPTGQTKSRADAADSVLRVINRTRELINDPDVRSNLGVLPGSVTQIEQKIGDMPPKMRELVGLLKSIYSFAGTMHGWRSLKVAEEFEKAYGGLRSSPEGLLSGLNAMETTAKDVYETGYKHPYGQKSNAGAGAGANPPHAVDKILDEIIK